MVPGEPAAVSTGEVSAVASPDEEFEPTGGGYVRRLLTTGAAYQVADIVAKVFALVLLPIYTRQLTRADYGTSELILTTIIFVSIMLRLGLVEAFVRFTFLQEDVEKRRALARTSVTALLILTTVASIPCVIFARPIAELILDRPDAAVMRAGVLGLWAFTNLELAYGLLRVEERARAYLISSVANVVLTTVLTVVLVVGFKDGAFGLVFGNYAASAVILLFLWWGLRDQLGLNIDREVLRSMLKFGLPTVPAELSVFALFFVDRLYLYRAQSASLAGLYALAVKLAGVVVFTVRAFQYAWPPLIYSITDDDEAAHVYARVTTYYVLLCGLVVSGCTLLGRWLVRVLADEKFFAAHEALPWVALGWGLYGLYLVFVTLAGRAQVTVRSVPAAIAGLVANVIALVALVPPLGVAGAGVALCVAYAVILSVMVLLTRRLLPISYEWGRLAYYVGVMSVVSVGGELLLPTSGVAGFLERGVLWCILTAALCVPAYYRDRLNASAASRSPSPS